MKKTFFALVLLLVGCNSQPQPVSAQAPALEYKYSLIYSQTINLDGTNRWLGEIRDSTTGEVFLVIQGSEMHPYTVVKK
jgi:hypothetical protein